MIEILAWTPDRATFVTGMTTTLLPVQVGVDDDGNPIMADGPPLCTLDAAGNLVPLPGIAIDEIGPIVKTPAVLDEDGQVVTPAVVIGGHHVNLLAHGAMADMLTAGLPQTDEAGERLGLFERTRLLTLISGLQWDAISQAGEPPGYVGPNGVKLYDPAVVNVRRRVWFGAGG